MPPDLPHGGQNPTTERVRLEEGASPVEGYRLLTHIARGGCGEVWQAAGPGDVRCALKFVRLEGRAGEAELRSLNLMRDIGHPHLVKIFGAWQQDGYLIVAMDLAERTLEQRLDEAVAAGLRGIPAAELLKYMSEAAEGIDYLNAGRGIQHRDVKPKNLLLKSGCVLVADFGLAKFLEQSFASHTLGTMTLAYAAPEFFEGAATRWSDQYALAVTYCQLRGSELPFRGNYAQVSTGHLTRPPDLTMLPAGERGPVARALDKDPKTRWPTCRAFIDALAPLVAAAVAPVERVVRPDTVPAARPGAPSPTTPDEVVNSLGMKFAWVPPGTFLMGSPPGEEGRSADEARHRVTLTKGFWLGVYPVTQAAWRAVMGGNPGKFRGDDLPVEMVSWEDCQEFFRKLAARDSQRYRLPTEAEWEYACRAGTTTPFAFGETISTEQANYDGSSAYGQGEKGTYRQATTPAGTFPANAWGLYDMHGNVWEWCADWYGPYPQGDVQDQKGPEEGEARALRGGSWYGNPRRCRSASRRRSAPSVRYGDYGCRAVLCLD